MATRQPSCHMQEEEDIGSFLAEVFAIFQPYFRWKAWGTCDFTLVCFLFFGGCLFKCQDNKVNEILGRIKQVFNHLRVDAHPSLFKMVVGPVLEYDYSK